jgi:hypothetical protein
MNHCEKPILASALERDVSVATIQIKTLAPDQAIPLVEDALALETKLTRDSLRTTDERIATLTGQLGITPDQVLPGAVPRTEDNEALLLDLERIPPTPTESHQTHVLVPLRLPDPIADFSIRQCSRSRGSTAPHIPGPSTHR